MAINVQLALSCGQEVDEKKIKSTVDYHGYRRTREVVIKISSGVKHEIRAVWHLEDSKNYGKAE